MELSLFFPDADTAALEEVTQQLEELGALCGNRQGSFDLRIPLIGEVIVALGSAGVVGGIVKIIHTYLTRHKDKDVEIKKPDGTTISLKGFSLAENERLLQELRQLEAGRSE